MGMPKDNTGSLIPVFAPDRVIAVAAGDLDTSDISAIMFSTNQDITIGSGSLAFPWPAGIPFGISGEIKKINVSVGGNAAVMV